MTTFRSHRRGQVYVELPAYAASLLANLTGQLVELLRDGEAPVHAEDPLEAMLTVDGPREPPDDPALRRLFPAAHLDDEEAAAEFRRFTEPTLRQSKADDGTLVLTTLQAAEESDGGDVEFLLDGDGARAWMRWLTALRLTLAERLGVAAGDEEYWESLDQDDERLPVYEIYSWLGYLLESLITAVDH
jgi:Domain of unknown function (DUF2017)